MTKRRSRDDIRQEYERFLHANPEMVQIPDTDDGRAHIALECMVCRWSGKTPAAVTGASATALRLASTVSSSAQGSTPRAGTLAMPNGTVQSIHTAIKNKYANIESAFLDTKKGSFATVEGDGSTEEPANRASRSRVHDPCWGGLSGYRLSN